MTALRLASLGVLLTASCASLRPIPPAQREPYFECQGVTLRQAELNLAEHGFVPKQAGEASITTEVTEVAIPEGADRPLVWASEVHTARLVDIHQRVAVRLLVYEAGAEAVRFKPFWGHRSDVAGHRGSVLLPVSDRLYYEQVEHDPTAKLLSKMREAVCGNAAPMQAPWWAEGG